MVSFLVGKFKAFNYIYLMKKIVFVLLVGSVSIQNNAQNSVKCGADIARNYLESNLATKAEQINANSFFNQILNNPEKLNKAVNATYVIPVVFHVFANNASNLVPLAQIQSGLNKINEDFNGWNADLATVDPEFAARVSSFNIIFALAQLDTLGNPCTGVTYHLRDSGFGNVSPAMNAKIASFAWPNYKYMNIYIMLDLFGNNVYNNSGIAFPPNTWDSDHRVDRIVYNYWYLGNSGSSIADAEFQSVLTHEYGHWLNLGHTFGNNCVDNDGIADTPTSDVAAGGCGPGATHCGGNINGENYMDYNATCYKMFTQGQVNVMLAALQHPTRFPLWQFSNLLATGLGTITDVKKNSIAEQKINYTISEKTLKTNADKIILYDFSGKVILEKKVDVIQLDNFPTGIYILALYKDQYREFHKILIDTDRD